MPYLPAVSMAERPWHNCSFDRRAPFIFSHRVSMAERPWHNCSATSAVHDTLLVDVSMAERPWHNCSPVRRRSSCRVSLPVSMAERPWHNCSALKPRLTEDALKGIHGRKAVAQLQRGYKRPIGAIPRSIHGRKAVAQLQQELRCRHDGLFAGIHGRKAVAQLQPYEPEPVQTSVSSYPWPKGRGTIAATTLQAGPLHFQQVSMAERPWHNCSSLGNDICDDRVEVSMAERPWHNCSSQLARNQMDAMTVSMAERPWHNCSARYVNRKAIFRSGIHGRKAVAQLQLEVYAHGFTPAFQVSMAERPWHNCSRPGRHHDAADLLVSMAERPWHNCSVLPS